MDDPQHIYLTIFSVTMFSLFNILTQIRNSLCEVEHN